MNVPPDVVHLKNIDVFKTISIGERGDETCCLATAHVIPGKEAQKWNIGEEADWNFVFCLIKRNDVWKISRGYPAPPEIIDYFSQNRNPFENIMSEVPEKVEKGKEYKLSFDLHLPRAFSYVEKVRLKPIKGIK